MMNPIKLILAVLFALISGCGESADPKPGTKDVKYVTGYNDSATTLQSVTQSTEFVAGLTPNQRPGGAPVVREFAPGADWRSRALAGVSEPVPDSLDFLDSQGAWYTPFNRPGMPGYYDLRNMHRTRNSKHTSQ